MQGVRVTRELLEELQRAETVATAGPWVEDCLTLKHFERFMRRKGGQRSREDIQLVCKMRSVLVPLIKEIQHLKGWS